MVDFRKFTKVFIFPYFFSKTKTRYGALTYMSVNGHLYRGTFLKRDPFSVLILYKETMVHTSVIRFQVNLQNVKKKLLDLWELSCFVASGLCS